MTYEQLRALTPEQYAAREVALYDEAEQWAHGYLRDKNLSEPEHCTFDDLVESFFSCLVNREHGI
jgi:hypothetical protein